jgi:small subunit ribosomal protein S4
MFLQPGDVVGVVPKSLELEFIKSAVAKRGKQYNWLDWNNETNVGTFIALPQRADIPENINEQLIVELYSK